MKTCLFFNKINILHRFIFIGILLFYTNFAFSQGSTCASATNLTINSVTATVNVNGAAGTPALSGCTSNAIVNEIWFAFTVSTAYSVVTFSNMGSQNAYIYVYSGACGALTDVSCVSVSIGSINFINFPSVVGQKYYVRILQADAGGSVNGRVGVFSNSGNSAAVCVPDKAAFWTGYAEQKGGKNDDNLRIGALGTMFDDNYSVGYAKFRTDNIPSSSITVNNIYYMPTFVGGNTNYGGMFGITKMKNDASDPVSATGNAIYQNYDETKPGYYPFYANVDPNILNSDATYVYDLINNGITNFSSRYTQGWWGITMPVQWNTMYFAGEEFSFYGWNSQYYPYIVVTYTPICVKPTITTQPTANINQCKGTNVNLSITATGEAPLSYQWFKDGNPITDATTTSLDLTNITTADNGSYTCVVTNNCPSGTATSNAAVLTVVDQPVISFSDIIDEDCGSANGSVTVNATGGNGSFTYLWNTTPQQNTQTINNLQAGSYIVTVSSAGCSSIDTVIINNTGGATVTISSTDEHCGKGDATATANASGGSGNYTYIWSTNPPQTDQTALNLSEGSYFVTVSDGSCNAIANVTINNIQGPKIDSIINFKNESCSKANATAQVSVSGGTLPYAYLWSTTPPQQSAILTGVQAGKYFITITDSQNCSVVDSVIFTNSPAPVLTLVSKTDDQCGKNEGSISVSVSSGSPPYSYKWNVNPALDSATINNLSKGIYTVTVTDSVGCTAILTDSIINIVSFSVFIRALDAHCNQSNGSAFVEHNPNDSLLNYKWSSNSLINNDTLLNIQPGDHYVVVSDTLCSDTLFFSINSQSGPTADFVINPEILSLTNGLAYLNDASTGAVKWQWKVKDAVISNRPNTTFVVTEPGEYLITLIITDGYGCTDSISKILTVKEDFYFYIPNSFTPNGNGNNDKFIPITIYDMVENYRIDIFNRWGQELYSSTDITEGWDGTAEGKLVPAGVYSYRITFKEAKGKKRQYIGSIILFR